MKQPLPPSLSRRVVSILLLCLPLFALGAFDLPNGLPQNDIIRGDGPFALSIARAATGCSTVYYVQNTGSAAASYDHVFSVGGTEYHYAPSTLAAGEGASYNVASISATPALPDTFSGGSLTVYSDQPLSAQVTDIAGCDSLKYLWSSTSGSATPMVAGQTYNVSVTVVNTSQVFTWPAGGPNPIRVGYHWYSGSSIVGSWDDNQRGTLSADVAPGASTIVTVPVIAPANPGSYTLKFDLVHEGISWYSWKGAATTDVTVGVNLTEHAAVSWVSNDAPSSMIAGQTYNIQVTVQNTSSALTWSSGGSNPVRIGYHWYNGSALVGAWDDDQRGELSANVTPGGSATVTVPVIAPSSSGNLSLRFDLLEEYVAWFSWRGAPTTNIAVSVYPNTPDYTAVSWVSNDAPSSMTTGQTYNVQVVVQNTSSYGTWSATGSNPVRIGYHWYNGSSIVGSWDDDQRGDFSANVAPGGSATVTVPVRAPNSAGNLSLRFDLVREGITWFSWQGASTTDAAITVRTDAPDYTAVNWVSNNAPSTMTAGQTYNVQVTVQNTGASAWGVTGSTPVRIGYHWYNGSTIAGSWDDNQRGDFSADVAPGGSATVTVPVKAPSSGGNLTLRFDIVQEYVMWFSWQGGPMTSIAVAVGTNTPEYAAVSWVSNDAPSTMTAGQTYNVQITVQNTGATAWTATGSTPVRIGYHWYNGSTVVGPWDDNQRGDFSADVAPGGSATVTVPVNAPSSGGNLTLRFDIVQEYVMWFSWRSGPMTSIAVAVGTNTPEYAAVSWVSNDAPSTMTAGQTYNVQVTVQNAGASAWTVTGSTPVRIGYHWYNGSTLIGSFDDNQRGTFSANVAPGGSATVTVPVNAPSSGGNLTLRFDVLQEYVTWFSWGGAPTTSIAVAVGTGTPDYSAVQWVSNNAPSTMSAGQITDVQVTVRNDGSSAWVVSGSNPVRIGYHWYNGSSLVGSFDDNQRGTFSADVAPGASATVTVPVRAPSSGGTLSLRFDVLREGVTWFAWAGAPTTNIVVTVN